jgi:hypothetical protein
MLRVEVVPVGAMLRAGATEVPAMSSSLEAAIDRHSCLPIVLESRRAEETDRAPATGPELAIALERAIGRHNCQVRGIDRASEIAPASVTAQGLRIDLLNCPVGGGQESATGPVLAIDPGSVIALESEMALPIDPHNCPVREIDPAAIAWATVRVGTIPAGSTTGRTG